MTNWGSTTSDRQPGDEEIFCIDSERVAWARPTLAPDQPESRVAFSWRIDGLAVPEGGYTDAQRRNFTGISVYRSKIEWKYAENFRWDPEDWIRCDCMGFIPVEEYLRLLSDAVEENERELEAYLQERVRIDELTVELDRNGCVVFRTPRREEDVLYVEQQLPDGTYRVRGGLSYERSGALDFYVQPGETYYFRCSLVGMKYPFISNPPTSKFAYFTVTIPENWEDVPEHEEQEPPAIERSEKNTLKLSPYPGLVRRSDLIVYGTVQDKGVDRYDRDHRIYHDVYVEVEECYLGDAEPGARIRYREYGSLDSGGAEAGYPWVESGAKVVLYLFEGSREIKPDQLVDLSSGTVTLRKSSLPGYRMSKSALMPPEEDHEEQTLRAGEYLDLLREDAESGGLQAIQNQARKPCGMAECRCNE